MSNQKIPMSSNNESGRSLIEMLGVLAVIGVLSVTGIMGFNNAMDKNRANTIINEAQKRAVLIAPQMQIISGTNPILNGFENNDLGYAKFDTKIYTKADGLEEGRFGIKVSSVPRQVCQYMLRMVSNTAIRQVTTVEKPITPIVSCNDTNTFLLVYNSDISLKVNTSDYTTEDACLEADKKWCTKLGTGKCMDNDCCDGYDVQCCESSTGEFSNGHSCNYNFGTDNGICDNGSCVAKYVKGMAGTHEWLGNTSENICPRGYHWASLSDIQADFGCSNYGERCINWPLTDGSWTWLSDCAVAGGATMECNDSLYGFLVRNTGNIIYTGRVSNSSNVACVHD